MYESIALLANEIDDQDLNFFTPYMINENVSHVKFF